MTRRSDPRAHGPASAASPAPPCGWEGTAGALSHSSSVSLSSVSPSHRRFRAAKAGSGRGFPAGLTRQAPPPGPAPSRASGRRPTDASRPLSFAAHHLSGLGPAAALERLSPTLVTNGGPEGQALLGRAVTRALRPVRAPRPAAPRSGPVVRPPRICPVVFVKVGAPLLGVYSCGAASVEQSRSRSFCKWPQSLPFQQLQVL
jgi:hypothetical protein